MTISIPTALWIDVLNPNSLLVCLSNNALVVRIDLTTNAVEIVAGSTAAISQTVNVPATSVQLALSEGILGDTLGNYFITDTFNNRILKVDAVTKMVTLVAGTGVQSFNGDNLAATSTNLFYPVSLWLDTADRLYFGDNLNHRIRRVNGGVVHTVVGNGGTVFSRDGLPATSTTMNRAFCVYIDNSNGELYFTATYNNVVRKVDPVTQLVRVVAGVSNTTVTTPNHENTAATSAILSQPGGVWGNTVGSIYFTSLTYHSVSVVTGGQIATVVGTYNLGYNGDNQAGTSTTLNQPYFVTGNTANELYIGDTLNNLVRKVSSAGIVNNLMGVVLSNTPSMTPSQRPSQLPSLSPTQLPSPIPTVVSSVEPSTEPTTTPSRVPSNVPTIRPSPVPTTAAPTEDPSLQPTLSPTDPPINSTFSLIIIVIPFVGLGVYWYYYTHHHSDSTDDQDKQSQQKVKYNQILAADAVLEEGGDEYLQVELSLKYKKQSSGNSSSSFYSSGNNPTELDVLHERHLYGGDNSSVVVDSQARVRSETIDIV